MSNKLALSIAVQGLNNKANPEGLILRLLVFGKIPKLSLGNIEDFCPDQKKRFVPVELARKEMEQIDAKKAKVILKNLCQSNRRFGICPGSKVLVYREKKNLCERLYIIHKYDKYRTAYVDTGKIIEPFSITPVKLSRHEKYLKENEIAKKVENFQEGEKEWKYIGHMT